ncbi:hypothetical protein [Proteus terrae]|uniref:hypothetical protein n=1 Tax=Proteus terrae TaxID=1574161 RepID=UPI00301D3CD6
MEDIRNDVINFMNEFIQKCKLPLTISRIDDDIYRKIGNIRSNEIDWDWAIDFLNSDNCFDLAIGIHLNNDIDGLAIGIYQKDGEILEVQAIESFVRFEEEHPLRGRMVELTIIAAAYFVTLVEGKGVHIVDPLDPKLIAYYEKFGFVLDSSFDETCVKRMVSDIGELMGTVQNIIDQYS